MKSHRFNVCSEEHIIQNSADPVNLHFYTPSIVVARDNSLIISHDVGGNGVTKLREFKKFEESSQRMVCLILKSSDGGTKFKQVAHLHMCHARLFRIKEKLFIIGHNGYVQIACSDDNGESWSHLSQLTTDFGWHSSACNVIEKNGRIYLCMERRSDSSIIGWNVAGMTPHVLSARIDHDLMDAKNWTISKSYSFIDRFGDSKFPYFGIPFMEVGYKYPVFIFAGTKTIKSSPMGWLEANLVHIKDKKHIWHDPSERTLYIFLRLNTAGVGYAALLKVIEIDEGGQHSMYTELVKAPSGEPMTFIPFPGGHNKFYIHYDEVSARYWLACTQPSDSMIKIDHLDSKRHNLPSNERNRLVLYHSKNSYDWLFAGYVSIGETEQSSRNYPSICTVGSDMIIASRAGDENAEDSQYNNLIMIHKVPNFRELVY